MNRAGRWRFLVPLLLAGIFLLALGLRFYCLDCRGFWGDEVSSMDAAQLGWPTIFTGRFGYLLNQTPLHYLLVWLTMQPVDPTTSTVVGRLPSALGGALTVLVVYGLGKEMFGAAQGLVAAPMLALAAIHLNYSQELRPYALLVLFTTLSVYCLLRAVRAGQQARSTQGWWWVAFAAATITNLLYSYFALTLAIPAMAPFMAWVLWKQWSRRRDNPRGFVFSLVAFAVVGVACAGMLLDTLQTPRRPLDLAHYSPQAIVGSVVELMSWFTLFGFEGQVERLVQFALLLLASAGLVLGLRSNTEGALVCAVFVVVPPVILSIFGTTNAVFQRYALFSMPFYFLLIANGLVWLLRLPRLTAGPARIVVIGLGMVLAALVAVIFAIGAYSYFDPQRHIDLSYRPDYRGVAAYLSSKVSQDDMIVFVDEPPLGFTNSNFYWKNKPPAPIFDARDPRLFAYEPKGDIYWVVITEKLDPLHKLASAEHGWAETKQFERVAVLREAHPKGGMVGSMNRMAGLWSSLLPKTQPTLTLLGSAYQGSGDITKAVQAYKNAGTYFPVGDDYLRAAMGYEALGNDTYAWREADISKFVQPQRPEVHQWMAKKLSEEGYTAQSRVEEQIAAALAGGS